MKKILMMFCASAVLASCAGMLDDDKTPVQNGEIEKSYISINLMSADPDTRAEGATYQDGSEAERKVNSAYFFFFQNGQPFPVTVTEGAVTAPGTGANFLSATLTGNTGKEPNVSDVKDVVLLLRNYKGQYPNQIVAVLNWVPVAGESYTMAELAEVVDIQSTMDSQKYFVMSNAVYADGAGQAVTATPLTLADIYTTEEGAKENPVEIYVERIAAKVTVTAPAEKKFDLNKTVNVGGTAVKAYAEVTGWELYNEFNESYLLKQINPAWTVDAVGFNWNDQAFFRSYWATSPAPAWTPEGNAFTWNGGLGFGLSADVTAGIYASNSYVYCGENTTAAATDRTKVILKAKLVNETGDALELARWHGAEYLSESDLLTAVASTLKNTYYYGVTVGETTTYTSLDPTDLQCVVGGATGAPAGVDATEVYFQLSTAGADKEWFEYSSANGYTAVTDDALNEKLEAVPSGILYKEGQTYYFFDIKHLGAAGKSAEYGVVRNHIYSININSIGGFGSPVYDPDTKIETPQYPEEPTDQGSFVSAKVNVLSWRIVSQGVDIQPQPAPGN
jgi:hypothetical protein